MIVIIQKYYGQTNCFFFLTFLAKAQSSDPQFARVLTLTTQGLDRTNSSVGGFRVGRFWAAQRFVG